MDDLIARIIARIEKNASIAADYSAEVAAGYGNAANIVREAWEEEQARIAEEERADYVPTKAEERHSEDPDMYPLPSGTNHYTDTYPSGLSYAACGEPHPSPENIARRCSREAGHGGPHLNRWGNEWTTPDPWAEVRDLPPTVAWHEEGR